MTWYRGPTLMTLLDNVEIDETRVRKLPLRLPIQWVNRPNPDFRGFVGTIVAGRLRQGEAIRVQPSGRTSRVARIVTFDGDLEEAVAGQAITITLADEIDVSRGDLVVAANEPAEISDQFEATIVWMNEAPLLPGRSYFLKIGTKTVTGTVAPLKCRINVNTLQRMAASKLDLNEIGICDLVLDRPIAFDPYQVNRDTGGFILIDRITNDTVGAGMLHFALRRASNVQWQALDVNKTGPSRDRSRACCGSPGCRAPGSRPSPTWSRRSCTASSGTPTCSMATTSGTGSTRTWASPTRIAWRTFAASPRSRS